MSRPWNRELSWSLSMARAVAWVYNESLEVFWQKCAEFSLKYFVLLFEYFHHIHVLLQKNVVIFATAYDRKMKERTSPDWPLDPPVAISDCNPGIEFSIPGSGIEKFVILGSLDPASRLGLHIGRYFGIPKWVISCIGCIVYAPMKNISEL